MAQQMNTYFIISKTAQLTDKKWTGYKMRVLFFYITCFGSLFHCYKYIAIYVRDERRRPCSWSCKFPVIVLRFQLKLECVGKV
jgi:hypothetical protein